MSADTTHRQGCPAAGGYGHGVEDCICGADATPGLAPCPFCGAEPSIVERPDNIDGTEFFCALACYCDGYSACAHKMAVRKTPEQAKADAIEAWNRRAPAPAPQGPTPEELGRLFVEETGFDMTQQDADVAGFTYAVLARWGAPAASGEPVARRPLTDEQVGAICDQFAQLVCEKRAANVERGHAAGVDYYIRDVAHYVGHAVNKAAHGIKP